MCTTRTMATESTSPATTASAVWSMVLMAGVGALSVPPLSLSRSLLEGAMVVGRFRLSCAASWRDPHWKLTDPLEAVCDTTPLNQCIPIRRGSHAVGRRNGYAPRRLLSRSTRVMGSVVGRSPPSTCKVCKTCSADFDPPHSAVGHAGTAHLGKAPQLCTHVHSNFCLNQFRANINQSAIVT